MNTIQTNENVYQIDSLLRLYGVPAPSRVWTRRGVSGRCAVGQNTPTKPRPGEHRFELHWQKMYVFKIFDILFRSRAVTWIGFVSITKQLRCQGLKQISGSNPTEKKRRSFSQVGCSVWILNRALNDVYAIKPNDYQWERYINKIQLWSGLRQHNSRIYPSWRIANEVVTSS